MEWDTLLSHGAVKYREGDDVTEQQNETQEISEIAHPLALTRVASLSDDRATAHLKRLPDTIMPRLR